MATKRHIIDNDSDHFSEEEESESLSSEDARRGLPLHIQKQLLCDIKSAGGISACIDFVHLYNRRPEIYGAPSTVQRRKVRNKIQRWKGLTGKQFHQLHEKLFDSRITPPSPIMSFTTPTRKTKSIPDESGLFSTPKKKLLDSGG